MPTSSRYRQSGKEGREMRMPQRSNEASEAVRDISDEWARLWNARNPDGIASLYAEDAVYLPPHHKAVHGRNSIREYLRTPIAHGISDLAFTVTYIKQQGSTAWDVGTYRMMIPQPDGTQKEDRGKYLSVWRLTGKSWLLVADAWSSDLPAFAGS